MLQTEVTDHELSFAHRMSLQTLSAVEIGDGEYCGKYCG